MVKDPTVSKGVAKKRTEEPAKPPAQKPKTNDAADAKGKIVRTDSPDTGATQPIAGETVDTEVPKSPARKPAASALGKGKVVRKDPASAPQPILGETVAWDAASAETAAEDFLLGDDEPAADNDLADTGATQQLMQETEMFETSEEDAEAQPPAQTRAVDMSSEETAQPKPVDQTMALNLSAEETAEPEPPTPAKPAKADAEKGATVLGDYKLLKKLGEGGMGAVYKAHHGALDRVVAIKVLAKQLIKKKEFVQRFEREARVMAKLDHPNVLRCIDVKKTDAGVPYIVMEFVDGGSVEGWLKKLGRFSVGDAMHIVLKTAYALQHAHEKSLIHRDIKPDNLLLTKSGIVKVADLGLAKDTDDDVSLTKSGAGAGTPIYMAPEQAYNVKHCDSRVDIYALGVMLYVFLTGHPPFQGATAIELIMAKEKGKFDPIRKHNDEVPSKLDLIVDKMLAKDPKSRYASCQEVIDDLEPLGLANDELSFLAPAKGPDKDATVPNVKRAPKPAPKPAPTKTPSPAAKISSKTAGIAKSPATKISVDEKEEVEKDVWYWNLVTKEGKPLTKKVTSDQVRTLIKAGHIDPTAQLSRTAKSGFRAAATFPEFQSSFKTRETATKANVKGQKYRDQYKDLEAADARRRRWGWLTRSFKGLGGLLIGLLWIVLILGIVGIGGYFAWTYLR
jgi:serine/threonine protein kinase